MTINDPKAFCDGLWDWHILDGCFGDTKIRLTDVDGSAERNGHFLWIEAKAPGANIPLGQEIFYKKIAERGDTVIIVWGETNRPEKLRLLYRGAVKDISPCDLDKFRDVVSRWFHWANR